jgi:apoptotic chromatin condensation inducer in the nucleus
MSDSGILEDGRQVADLKVVELREELQKRGLSRTGNKKELADRLRGFIATGTGEISDKSTPNSPVKSPVNSLVAQYRLTQQQLLKDAQKEPEPSEEKKDDESTGTTENEKEEVVENGHKEDSEAKVEPELGETKKHESPPPTEDPLPQKEKEQSPVKEVEEQASPPSANEEKEPLPMKETPVEEKPLEEQIPKAVSPIADREKSDTPEREVATPPAKEEESPVNTETSKVDAIDRAISQEPEVEEDEREDTPSPTQQKEQSIQEVSGGESDTGSRSRSPSPSNLKHQQQNANKQSDEEGDNDSKQSATVDENKKKPEVYTEGIVYVKEETIKPKSKLSTVSQNNEDRTPEGFIRRVTVSPPRMEATNCIHIRGLKRPCTPMMWDGFLEKFGITSEDDHWVDQIKSNAIIRFATVEDASKARDAIHHILWPEGNGCELLVSFTDEKEFIARKGIVKKTIKVDEEMPLSRGRRSPSPMLDDLPSPKEDINNLRKQRERDNVDKDDEPIAKKRKEQKSLDDLFRKTLTHPPLYYLPLSDEEVARKQAQKAAEKRELPKAEASPSAAAGEASTSTKRLSPRRRSPSPYRGRRSSPPRGGRRYSPPRRSRDGGRRDSPPRRPRSPRRSSPSKRRDSSPKPSTSTRKSPPSSRKAVASPPPTGKKTPASPLPSSTRRRSPSPPSRKR